MISSHGILLAIFICGSQSSSGDVSSSFIDNGLVSDILSEPPTSLLNVKYPSGAVVSLGNELSVPQVATAPSVSWSAQDGKNYTVLMIDPDAPSRKIPKLRSFLHWMVINARDDDVKTGNTIAPYIVPIPSPGLGLHRYTFLVYRQPSELAVEDVEKYEYGRLNFSPEKFAAENNLGKPIGGNFFQAGTGNI